MPIRFVNDKVKIFLAQKGVPGVFGREVDVREKLSGAEAIAWFDRVWDAQLARVEVPRGSKQRDVGRAKLDGFEVIDPLGIGAVRLGEELDAVSVPVIGRCRLELLGGPRQQHHALLQLAALHIVMATAAFLSLNRPVPRPRLR